MGDSSKKQTVGYKYYVGMHMVLHHGSADRLLRVRVNGRDAFLGSLASGSVYIDKPSLFGGESREGGVQGQLDFETGKTSQMPNSYLVSKLGAFVTAFRGVTAVVLRQMYMGTNPYLKAWDFRPQRIHKRFDDQVQWYDEKAEIPILPPIGYDDSFRYKLETSTASPSSPSSIIGVPFAYTQPGFDDSGWDYGLSAFGSYSGAEPATYEPVPAIRTPLRNTFYGEAIWLRKKVFLNAHPALVGDLEVIAWKNDGGWLWVNGVRVDHEPFAGTDFNYFNVRFVVPSSLLVLGENTFAYQMIEMVVSPDGVLGGSAGGSLVAFRVQTPASAGDMNPAHIIRECLTDPDWGMGYQDADIDDAAFMAAADVLYDEGMGISIFWDTQTSIEEFVKEILKHIDAALFVDRRTGKFTLKLIRADYNEATLLILNESNIDKITDFKRPTFGELINSVTVTYWDAATGEDATITVSDIALAQQQGNTNSVSVKYQGFTKGALASRAAQRDLKSLSTPLASCTIYANRDADELNIGSVFKLDWPDYDVDMLVMRVTGIAFGDGKSNRIRIQCVQDVFALPDVAFIPDSQPVWEDPSAFPVPVSQQLVFEVPYLELVQAQGQTQVDGLLAANPDAGYVAAAAIRPASSVLYCRLFTDNGAGYQESGQVDFSPSAVLSEDISEIQKTFDVEDRQDFDEITIGSWFQMGTELMGYLGIAGNTITVQRGVLDTVPVKHSTGEVLIFWDYYAEADPTEYVTSDSIGIKLPTVSGGGQLALADAPSSNVTLNARAVRPYPPGNVKIGGVAYPATFAGAAPLALTWAHRDRLQQTGGDLVDTTEGTIGPEAGTTYTLRLYGEDDALLRTETGLTGTSYTWTTETNDSGLTVPGSGVADPYWDDVVALLHFNGPDASTTFFDERGHTFTAFGNAQIDTAQSKFGGAAAIFDGTGDWISTGASSDFDFGTGDFTVELWAYPTATGRIIIASNTASWSAGAVGIGMNVSNVPSLFAHSAGGTICSGPVVTGSAWSHIAVTRIGNTFQMYTNGVPGTPGTFTGSCNFNHNSGMRIGRNWDGDPYMWSGSMDDLRITKGVARYTASFTPPAAPFPSGLARLNGRIRFELESVRDGKTSYQKHNVIADRAGYGYNWGKYWGGPAP